MIVKKLKEELNYYDDDMEVIFEVCDSFEPESVTEDRFGNREVHLHTYVKPYHISDYYGDVVIELERVRE